MHGLPCPRMSLPRVSARYTSPNRKHPPQTLYPRPANPSTIFLVTTTDHLNRRIAAATGIVMASVLLSRVLGFFRDWTVAHQVGANAATGAYYAAFTLPDFLNYLIAGGSLSITFIPVFTNTPPKNAKTKAGAFFPRSSPSWASSWSRS